MLVQLLAEFFESGLETAAVAEEAAGVELLLAHFHAACGQGGG
ncbi:hypothetical protein ACODT3_37935 [Streptomyces sp. 4.24]